MKFYTYPRRGYGTQTDYTQKILWRVLGGPFFLFLGDFQKIQNAWAIFKKIQLLRVNFKKIQNVCVD